MKKDITNTILKILPLCNRSLDRQETIKKLNEILFDLLEEKKGLERFKELKEEMLEILKPSSNPDNFTDTLEALERSEKDLEASLI